MYEEDTTYVEGGLEVKSYYYETPVMDTGLERQVPNPELKDSYVNSTVMLPKINTYTRGKFIGRKRDVDGNAFGRTNYNPFN